MANDAGSRPPESRTGEHRASDNARNKLADPAYRFAALVILLGVAAVAVTLSATGFARWVILDQARAVHEPRQSAASCG